MLPLLLLLLPHKVLTLPFQLGGFQDRIAPDEPRVAYLPMSMVSRRAELSLHRQQP